MFHVVGNVGNFNQRPALFTKFAQQGAFRAVDAQRHFRVVVGQHLQGWQCRVGQEHRHAEQKHGQ